jgi:uncharacterized membrane protein
MAGVVAVGVALAHAVPSSGEGRQAAYLGVAAAGLSGVLAQGLKQRARSVNGALAAFAVGFLARLVLVVLGVWWTMRQGGEALVFTAGFFGVYFPLQWLEISYFLAEAKRRGGGQV